MGAMPLTALALSLALQVPQPSMTGIVRDADTGTPLAGATVALPDLDRGAVTDAEGRYELRDVSPGPQHLSVSYLGHATRSVHVLVPGSGSLRIDVALASDPIELEGLEVRAGPSLAGLEPAAGAALPDRTLSREAIRAHPMVAEPDPLVALAGGEIVLDPEAPTGVHVRGGAADHTAYTLDGIPLLEPVHVGGLFSPWSVDALERVTTHSVPPHAASTSALSGVIAARVRDPGPFHQVAASVSTTHTGVTMHGPLGGTPIGYVVSARSGFPGVFSPDDEPSYVRGETGDAMVKIVAPLLGGHLGVLYYDAENEISASSLTSAMSEEKLPARHGFEWGGESVGATWNGVPWAPFELTAWRARAGAHGTWRDGEIERRVDGRREDLGVQATVGRRSGGDRLASAEDGDVFGVSVRRLSATYGPPGRAEDARLALVTVFGRRTVKGAHSVEIGPRVEASLGGRLSTEGRELYVAPSLGVRWRPHPRWTATLAVSRTYQYTQSLRNPESVAGYVFPATLSVVAGVGDVPVPRSDQLVAAVDWRAAPSVRVTVQGHVRSLDGLILVAPLESGPFSTAGWSVGDGRVGGLSVRASASGARFGWLADYGWQRVRLCSDGVSWAPVHGTAHLVGSGIAVYPSPTISTRLSITAGFGRRATDVGGVFEWESCNLRDGGCEFAGSPRVAGPLGARELPPYLRVDLGARKHWHVHLAGRESLVAVHGTVTNVFGRTNVLTRAHDPGTGLSGPVTMRPFSPLVVGLEWHF